MRITNSTNPTPANSAETATPQTTCADSAAPGVPASHLTPSALAQASGLAPSFELLNLNAALHQLPPIRADIVADSIRRLASGQLRTPDALEQTASAILDGAARR